MLKCSSLIVLVALSLAPSCASILQGGDETVSVESTPSAAIVIVDGKSRGTTPLELELAADEDHVIEIALANYETARIHLESGFNGLVLLNLIVGGVVGVLVDCATGAASTLSSDEIKLQLQPGSGVRDYEVNSDGEFVPRSSIDS